MQEHVTFIRDDVLPSYWANRIQQLLSTYSDFLLSQATLTSIQIVAGADSGAAVCVIEGKWRFVEASLSRAHPGGAAGTYDIFATCKANNVTNSPDPFTDHTDYSFSLSIVAHNATPPIVAGVVDHFRKIGELKWDGAKITKVTQLVGVAPPDTQLAVGDIKFSLQAEDHPGWIKIDGRANLPRADYPTEISALMDSLGLVGVDAGHFAVPDGRGRQLVGLGTHADVNALLDSDGIGIVGNRRVKHTHTVANHSHKVPQVMGLIAGDFTFVNPAHFGTFYSEPVYGDAIRWVRPRVDGFQFLNTSGFIDIYACDSGGATPGTDAQGPAWLTVNIFVFTGEGTAGGGGGGGAGGSGVGAPNVQVANYILQVTDAGHVVEMNAAGATVVTVPSDASQPMAIGTIIEVARMGAGAVSLAAAGGVTLRSKGGLLGIGDQYGGVSLRKRAANDWVIVGDLA